MQLESPLESVNGVGPAIAEKFRLLGLATVNDLLNYYPRRYEDYSNLQTIAHIKPGKVSIKASIKQVSGKYVRGGLHITEAIASDHTGSLRLVWFNQPYRAAALKKDVEYFISGIFELRSRRLSIANPSMELESSFPVSTARIVPIYKETKGLTSLQIRKVLRTIFATKPKITETLPNSVLLDNKLVVLSEALLKKHFPTKMNDVVEADDRLGFEELFELILASQFAKRSIEELPSQRIAFESELAKKFVGNIQFELTNAQRKAVWQMYQDMDSEKPMNRLLEGDVGAGKTVVAAMAALMVIAEGYQVAFMAPTELLARQHADTIHALLDPLGMANSVTLLVGSMKPAQKILAQQKIKAGTAQMLVGTHALIQEKVAMPRLALAVIDEQHRFGVDQRKKLLAKAKFAPHLLCMTATPIPRSLALTVFGELDISILDEKPKSRLPIITKLIKPTDRDRFYTEIDKQIAKGQQMFVVCPLIEDSDFLLAKSAESMYKELKQRFGKRNVALLHGKMKADDKQDVMKLFVDGKTDILVATTVIEVGVDVPNANLMLIEAPERFGLAQLHQLRGRIGRGGNQGYCYLMLSDSNPPSRRLRAIESTQDGFKLAELDLELRGAGALYGTTQHGELDLRIANFANSKMIDRARKSALAFMKNPKNMVEYPYIRKRIIELQSVVHLN